jgi:nucleoside-diphosphate-sugar epimerase
VASLQRSIRPKRLLFSGCSFNGQASTKQTIMRVLVLGGTGSIGCAVVRELVARGHIVFGLARSGVSAAKLGEWGATSIAGDIASPSSWTMGLPPLDAIIHAACDFNIEMGAIDQHLLDVMLAALASQPKRPRFIYSGGCWLFGPTGDAVATEETPFNPLPAFAWMLPHLQRVLSAPEVEGIVIHPAMVYTPQGGVFQRFARDSRERDAIRVVGSEAVRWPLVHSEDLAILYALALERAPAGSSYIGAAVEGACGGHGRTRVCETARHPTARAGNHQRRLSRRRTRRMGEGICAGSALEQHQGQLRARLAAEASRPGKRDRRACLTSFPVRRKRNTCCRPTYFVACTQL